MGTSFLKSFGYWLIKCLKAVSSKAGQTALSLIIFSAAITWFYYMLANVKMDWIECWWFKERWRNLIIGVGTALVFYYNRNVTGNIHRDLLMIFKAIIILTYAIVILVNFSIITQPYVYFLSLDAGTFIVTLVVLILGIRHNVLDI